MDAFAKYCDKFGNPKKAIENLPYQLTVECFRNPYFLEEDERLDSLFGECVKRRKPFTEREFVDCLYLREDGVYSFDDVECKSYEKFLEEVAKIETLY